MDGALGTELARNGVNLPLPIWTADANLYNRDLVFKIHSDYVKAGADIITTNTFRTTSYTYIKAGYSKKRAYNRARDSFFHAVEIANRASKGNIILGSVTSIDDCYLPQNFPGIKIAEDIYQELMIWFENTNIKNILFETMGNMEEILIALKQSKGFKFKIWLSIILKNNRCLLDGTRLDVFFHKIKEYDISVLMINCNCIENSLYSIQSILDNWNGTWGCYPNLGKSELLNNYFDIISDKSFVKNIKNILAKRPNIIGACCGSKPHHIKLINQILRSE